MDKENRFLGWADIGLNERKRQEALEAGGVLKRENFIFDYAFTSMLKRAIKTLWMVLEEMDLMWNLFFGETNLPHLLGRTYFFKP